RSSESDVASGSGAEREVVGEGDYRDAECPAYVGGAVGGSGINEHDLVGPVLHGFQDGFKTAADVCFLVARHDHHRPFRAGVSRKASGEVILDGGCAHLGLAHRSHTEPESLAPRTQVYDTPERLGPRTAESHGLPRERSHTAQIEEVCCEAAPVEHEPLYEAEASVAQPGFDGRREATLVASGEDQRRDDVR